MSNRTDVENLQPVMKFLDSRCADSKDTRKTYLTGLIHLHNFVNPKNTIETILGLIKTGQMDVYDLLESFISDRRKKASIRTTRLNVAVLKSYLDYHDIDIIPAKFKRKVKVPKLHKAKEEPIDSSDIRKILLACNNRRLKTYDLVLASGGMRAVEGLAIRLKDIDFSTSPTKIHIRAEYAKTRVARDIYISDEATKYLQDLINWKYRNDRPGSKDDLVFGVGRSEDPRGLYSELSVEFIRTLDIAGFSERKDDSSRHKITLHSFRRFVDSTITTEAGQDFAEWFLGHADNSYFSKKEHELRQIYKTKCMKHLTFLDYTTLEATGKSIEAKISEKEKEIQGLEDKLKSMEESQRQSFEEFKQENRHFIAEAMTKFKATLSPKALDRFSRKSILEVLEE
jgi:integrase